MARRQNKFMKRGNESGGVGWTSEKARPDFCVDPYGLDRRTNGTRSTKIDLSGSQQCLSSRGALFIRLGHTHRISLQSFRLNECLPKRCNPLDSNHNQINASAVATPMTMCVLCFHKQAIALNRREGMKTILVASFPTSKQMD